MRLRTSHSMAAFVGLFLMAAPAGAAIDVTTITVSAQLPPEAEGVSEVMVDGTAVSVAADGSFTADVAIPAGSTAVSVALSWADGDQVYSRSLEVALEDLPAPIPDLDVSVAELQTFLGGKGGKLAWVDSGGQVQILDFTGSTATVSALPGATSAINPIISPDGTRVVYSVGSPNGPKFIWVQEIDSSNRNQLVTGMDIGYWHVDSLGNESIVYSDWSDKEQNGSDGDTYKQQLVTGGITASGIPDLIHDRAMDAGPNGDLSWLGQVYNQMFAYDLSGTSEYDFNQFSLLDGSVADHQTCNGSMAPDTSARLMLLVIPHDWVRVFTYAGGSFSETSRFNLPPGMSEWEFPEWSTDPAYFTAVLRPGGFNLRLYVSKVQTGEGIPELLPVTAWDTSVTYSHLWVAP